MFKKTLNAVSLQLPINGLFRLFIHSTENMQLKYVRLILRQIIITVSENAITYISIKTNYFVLKIKLIECNINL